MDEGGHSSRPMPQGGGIPRDKLTGANSVWSYGFTTTTGTMPVHQAKISLAEEHVWRPPPFNCSA